VVEAAALAGLIVAAAALAGCSGGPAPPTIEARDFAFAPQNVTLSAGQILTWRAVGQTEHTVTSDDPAGPLHGDLQPGQEYTLRFDAPGVYHYHCLPHSHRDPATGALVGMVGTVTVT
jgi:plastocyanin